MCDYLEVIFVTSVMILLIAVTTVTAGNLFGVLWRRIMWISMVGS